MIKRSRAKTWILVTLISILGVMLIGGSVVLSNMLFGRIASDNNSYVIDDLMETYLPVNNEVTDESKMIQEPFNDETVSIHINFYNYEDERDNQEKSLILYENTYMPNTGILYGTKESFYVLAAYEGEVVDIKTDEVFGTIIEIKHNNSFITKYSSLTNADVEVGDTVNAGEVIGTSGVNKVVSTTQNMLLFEIIYNGEYVNPNNFYNKTLEEIE